MSRIRFSMPDPAAFVDPRTLYPAAVLPLIPEPELVGSRVRVHHPGGEDEPQLFEVHLDPNVQLASHAHESSEIIVVLEGELRLGARTCPEGTSVLVPGGTLYSAQSGPDGARFLNFRGAADWTYLDRDTYMARRRETNRDDG